MKKITSMLLALCFVFALFPIPCYGDSVDTFFGWPVRSKWCFCLDRYPSGSRHTGIDINAGTSTDVKSVGIGTVVRVVDKCTHVSKGSVDGPAHNCYKNDKTISQTATAEEKTYGQLGNWVAIEHNIEGVVYTTVYGHLSHGTIKVTVGQSVNAGTVLGKAGSSGNSTGSHLHFTIYKGKFGSASPATRSKTFQYYLNNPSVLSGMTFNKHVSTSSVLFGDWIKENCVLKGDKWEYKGPDTGSQTPVCAKTVPSSDGTHIYERYDYSMTWSAAKAFCETKGGHLATILNNTEQKDVLSVLDGCTKNVYFIGGTDEGSEGNWKWLTGEAFSYSNWDQDYIEPSNESGENFAAIMGKNVGSNKQKGDWIDIKNAGDSSHSGYAQAYCGFICEYDYVVYDANGGSGAPAKQQKVFNKALTLSSVFPKRPGYSFRGWSTNKNATTAQYQAGGTYNKNTAVKLYAVWEKNYMKIRYYVQRGTVTAEGYSVTSTSGAVVKGSSLLEEIWYYDTSSKLISAETLGLVRPGYIFAGWKQSYNDIVFSPDKQLKAQEIYAPIASYYDNTVMLFAVWTPVEVSSVLSLPENLKKIESEAFVSVGADAIIVPTSVETIADDAFSEDVILIGERGSQVQLYAAEKGLPFIELKDYVNDSVLP